MEELEGLIELSRDPASRRCLVISGAVHGNEPAGPFAIEHLQKLLASGDWNITGNCFALIGNPEAYKKGVRFIDENLNRAFGRYERPDSYEARRGKELYQWFESLQHEFDDRYMLDLHSVSIGDVRMAIAYTTHPQSSTWLESVSPIPLRLLASPAVLPGTSILAFDTLGGTSITIECGNHSSEFGVAVALEHIENALRSLAMLSSAQTSFRNKSTYDGTHRTYELTDIIKPREGFAWDMSVASEVFLSKDQVYAHDAEGIHTALQDCYLMMPSKHPQPEDFDAGFLAVKK